MSCPTWAIPYTRFIECTLQLVRLLVEKDDGDASLLPLTRVFGFLIKVERSRALGALPQSHRQATLLKPVTTSQLAKIVTHRLQAVHQLLWQSPR